MNSLVADYDSGSNTTDSSENDEDEKPEINLPKPRFELPKPDFMKGTDTPNCVENSVFVNPFIEAVNAKNAILEKHVKMISTDVKMVNGKPICWNYRKNKCRFGHNCKFAHDSDIQVEQEPKDTETTEEVSKPTTDKKQRNNDVPGKRKRPGLCQTLVPGKKVMKLFTAHKKTQ